MTSERCLFVAPPKNLGLDPLKNHWDRVQRETGGLPMCLSRVVEQPNANRQAIYVSRNVEDFFRAIPVREDEQAMWSKEAPNFARRLQESPNLLLEKVETLTPDHLVCHILNERHWLSVPDVVIDAWEWDYVTDIHGSATISPKFDGKRAFLSRDGLTLWEIEEVLAPLAKGQPVRIEIVRRRSLAVSGLGSVFEKRGLDFILDPDQRRRWTEHILRLEHEFIAGMSPRIIHDCAVAAEGLLLEIGKQRVRGGLPFGKFASAEEIQKLLGEHLKPLADAFTALLEAGTAKDEAKWVPGALMTIRAWGEEGRHPGKDERQLLDVDGFTAAFCYGALRDFVRLCQHIHAADKNMLAPPETDHS